MQLIFPHHPYLIHPYLIHPYLIHPYLIHPYLIHPYRASVAEAVRVYERATNGSVGGSERTSVRPEGAYERATRGSVRIWSEVTPYNKYLSIKTCIKIS